MYRLLIADDETLERQAMKLVLKRTFKNLDIVEDAKTGDEAILLAKKYSPHIIIMDIKMPNKNGLEAQREISKFLPDVKTIILTAYDDFNFAQDAIKLGVKDYILKPAKPSELKNSINKILTSIKKENSNFTAASVNSNKTDLDKNTIHAAIDFINQNFSKDINLENTATKVHLSPQYFSRYFKYNTGVNFIDYLSRIRIKESKRLLTTTEKSIRSIALSVGYTDPAYFSKVFAKHEGLSPNKYRSLKRSSNLNSIYINLDLDDMQEKSPHTYKIENMIKLINEFTLTSTYNRIQELNNIRIFDTPLVGVSEARDPLFLKLKDNKVVDPKHLTPKEWMPEAKSVISYFLPFSPAFKNILKNKKSVSSLECIYEKFEDTLFINMLCKFISKNIEDIGGISLIPSMSPRFSVKNYKSNWSEKHIAFISGLGTLSLNKTLITKRGCAGRLGSIIVSIPYRATKRAYRGIYDYCNSCGNCIEKCPYYAISKYNKDNSTYVNFLCDRYQLSLPCEHKIPIEAKKRIAR
ncbi:response regulator [uncultured Clostridium sp.]|uniref:response regulator n=1 Tax=uncultured Clostridium sp. TaxID=59620 RepID=UPI0025F202BD|nr:response regulator [uncultured Clostridium sp.]NLU07331.1 response regulator [Clostridiales bacterium]